MPNFFLKYVGPVRNYFSIIYRRNSRAAVAIEWRWRWLWVLVVDFFFYSTLNSKGIEKSIFTAIGVILVLAADFFYRTSVKKY